VQRVQRVQRVLRVLRRQPALPAQPALLALLGLRTQIHHCAHGAGEATRVHCHWLQQALSTSQHPKQSLELQLELQLNQGLTLTLTLTQTWTTGLECGCVYTHEHVDDVPDPGHARRHAHARDYGREKTHLCLSVPSPSAPPKRDHLERTLPQQRWRHPYAQPTLQSWRFAA
jgi:hypothetical protein